MIEHRLADRFELADPKELWLPVYSGRVDFQLAVCTDLEEAVLPLCLYRHEQMWRDVRAAVPSRQHEQASLRGSQQLGAVFAELLAAVQHVSSRPILPAGLQEVCRDYAQRVSRIGIAQEVCVVETEEVPVIWTIIDAPPFEDDLRDPIYEAQLQTLSRLTEHMMVDFRILNPRELPKATNRVQIVPNGAKTIWLRSR